MTTRDFVLLAYSAFGSKMPGKTTLQKRLYFLSVKLGKEDALGYRAHYYGPYSAAVAEANAELKSLGYVSELPTNWGSDVQGFEVVRYDYELTEGGKRIVERKKRMFRAEWSKICEAAQNIQAAGDLNYMELSVAAKAYFLLASKGDGASLRDIQEMAKRFGWSVKEDELRKASKFLEDIGLTA